MSGCLYLRKKKTGDEASCATCESNLTCEEKRAKLRGLAESVVDPYEGFALGLSVIAASEGFVDEAIAFMEDNPTAKSDDVIEYLNSLIDAKEAKVVCGRRL